MMQPINKRRIFQLIDSFEDSSIAGKWDQRSDDETLKIWSKLKGTELTKEHYIIKTCKTFKSKCEPERVAKALFNPSERLIWDNDMENCEVLKVVNGKYIIWYQIHKQAVKLTDQRDMVEKRMKFEEKGKIYLFFSSC